jgi:hypothetical protein
VYVYVCDFLTNRWLFAYCWFQGENPYWGGVYILMVRVVINMNIDFQIAETCWNYFMMKVNRKCFLFSWFHKNLFFILNQIILQRQQLTIIFHFNHPNLNFPLILFENFDVTDTTAIYFWTHYNHLQITHISPMHHQHSVAYQTRQFI